MFEFPKWKYSVTGGVIVDDADAEAALGAGWFNFPDEATHAQKDQEAADLAAADQANKDLEALRGTATDLGINIDGRWGAGRLEDEIKAKILANGNARAADAPAPEAEA
jgi:hypothetical protein